MSKPTERVYNSIDQDILKNYFGIENLDQAKITDEVAKQAIESSQHKLKQAGEILVRNLLLIDRLRANYPHKKSVFLADEILASLAAKEFDTIDENLKKLAALAKEETSEFSIARTLLTIMTLTTLAVLLSLVITYAALPAAIAATAGLVIASATAAISLQVTLLVSSASITLIAMNPLTIAMIVTNCLLLTHIIAPSFLPNTAKNLGHSILQTIKPLFYRELTLLKNGLEQFDMDAKAVREIADKPAWFRALKKLFDAIVNIITQTGNFIIHEAPKAAKKALTFAYEQSKKGMAIVADDFKQEAALLKNQIFGSNQSGGNTIDIMNAGVLMAAAAPSA